MAEDGTLVLATPLGELRESAPIAWQELDGRRQLVAVQYEIVSQLAGDMATSETEVGFRLGAYDPSRPLVIDPTLVYASYIGGDKDDSGSAIAVDASGAVYVAGSTSSTQTTFPDGDGFGTVPGYDQTYSDSADAFVIKLSPDGRSLAYATYLGGSVSDYAFGIAVDSSGAAYVAGRTNSNETTFPTGAGGVSGFDTTENGLEDAFVIKLAPSGQSIVYATYLGGPNQEAANGIAVDGSGAAYVVGEVQSNQATFPNGKGFGTGAGQVNVPGFDQTHNGFYDAFVVKLAPDGLSLAYATYIGGSGDDRGAAIAVSSGGVAYITGGTGSNQTTFPNGTGFAGLGVPGLRSDLQQRPRRRCQRLRRLRGEADDRWQEPRLRYLPRRQRRRRGHVHRGRRQRSGLRHGLHSLDRGVIPGRVWLRGRAGLRPHSQRRRVRRVRRQVRRGRPEPGLRDLSRRRRAGRTHRHRGGRQRGGLRHRLHHLD